MGDVPSAPTAPGTALPDRSQVMAGAEVGAGTGAAGLWRGVRRVFEGQRHRGRGRGYGTRQWPSLGEGGAVWDAGLVGRDGNRLRDGLRAARIVDGWAWLGHRHWSGTGFRGAQQGDCSQGDHAQRGWSGEPEDAAVIGVGHGGHFPI